MVEILGHEVLVLRVEERVLRSPAARIFEAAKPLGILATPACDAFIRDVPRWSCIVRFVVVADGDEDVHGLVVAEPFKGGLMSGHATIHKPGSKSQDWFDDRFNEIRICTARQLGQRLSQRLGTLQSRAQLHAEEIARQPLVEMLTTHHQRSSSGLDNEQQ